MCFHYETCEACKLILRTIKTLKLLLKNVFASLLRLKIQNIPHMRYFVLTQTKSDVFLITLNVTPIARLVWLLVEKCEIFWKCSQSKGFWGSLAVFSGMVQYNPMKVPTKLYQNPNTIFFSHFVNFSKCQKDSPLLLLRGSQQQKWTTLSTFSKKKWTCADFVLTWWGPSLGYTGPS